MYEIERREEVTSTNDICLLWAKEGKSGHRVCCAGKQTKGRGRNGRNWISQEKVGLYLSVLERPDCSITTAPLFSLAMGLAGVRAVEEVSGLTPKLKWPNDLVIGGKKLSGILSQMGLEKDRVDYVICGIGINLFQDSFPDEIADTATSILLENGQQPDDFFREKLENSIVKWWETYYNHVMQNQSFAGLKEEYEQCLANLGQEVRVLDPAGEYSGICKGIDQEGSLLVETADHVLHKVRSGEVSVRGIYGYV
ncbi:MAG: biotin--[acetyl-CoA-carboxylase] ligase [Lachnospiraceae bacterium]